MRHGIKGRKLNRTSAHRKALLKNLSIALVKHEQIKTTLPKSKELSRFVQKLITTAKRNNLHSRRLLISKIGCEKTADKLISVLAPRYVNRNGGYVRILNAGFRYGDSAPMAVIEFVDRDVSEKGKESGPVLNTN